MDVSFDCHFQPQCPDVGKKKLLISVCFCGSLILRSLKISDTSDIVWLACLV